MISLPDLKEAPLRLCAKPELTMRTTHMRTAVARGAILNIEDVMLAMNLSILLLYLTRDNFPGYERQPHGGRASVRSDVETESRHLRG